MKLKAKLISTIAAFAMVLCLTIVGVWAATSVKVNVTGTVTYTAKDVNATVTGAITGINESGKAYSKSWNADNNEATAEDTWDLSDITFVKNQSVVITLTVKNNDTARSLTATLVNEGAATGTNTTAVLGATTTATVAAGESQDFTFTISVDNWNLAASYSIDLALTLVAVA